MAEIAIPSNGTEDRIDKLENKLLQLQIDALKQVSTDHELRLRALEQVATKFNFLLALTMGGGVASVASLIYMIKNGGG